MLIPATDLLTNFADRRKERPTLHPLVRRPAHEYIQEKIIDVAKELRQQNKILS